MVNILKCDFYKFKKEKAHLILLLVMIGYSVLIFGLMYLAHLSIKSSSSQPTEGDGIYSNFAAIAYISALASTSLFAILSASITIGADFKNRTINLKVLSGSCRTKIYLSSIISNLTAFTFMFLLNMSLGLIGVYVLFGGFGDFATSILKATLVMYALNFAMVAVAYFVSFSLKSTLGLIINIVIVVLASQVFAIFDMLLSKYKFFDFIFSTIPHAVVGRLQMGALSNEIPSDFILKAVLGSTVISIASLAGGWLMMRKKELV